MRMFSTAQINRELDQLRAFLAVYNRHDRSDMVGDLEKRIRELENLLQWTQNRRHYSRRVPVEPVEEVEDEGFA